MRTVRYGQPPGRAARNSPSPGDRADTARVSPPQHNCGDNDSWRCDWRRGGKTPRDQQTTRPVPRRFLLSRDGIDHGSIDADTLLSGYCQLLYDRHGTYEEVARRTKLDRRTVKAYLEKANGAA